MAAPDPSRSPAAPKVRRETQEQSKPPSLQLRRHQTRQLCLLTTARLAAAGKYLLKLIQGIWRVLKPVFTSTAMENKDQEKE